MPGSTSDMSIPKVLKPPPTLTDDEMVTPAPSETSNRGLDYHLRNRTSAWLIKRTIDVVGAAIILTIFALPLLVISVLIRATSKGRAVFPSRRVGFGGLPFTCYKFRTMTHDAHDRQEELEELNQATGPIFKIHEDPRVTRVGHYLRATTIDELPQLFNVIGGSMSLVGPRPLPLRDCERLTENDHRRHSVLPGMTGLWQIQPNRHSPDCPSIVELDLKYIESWSIWLDLKILARTALVVLRFGGDAGPGTDED